MPAVAWLFVPAHRERSLARAFDADADVVILDLEDGVPVEQKERARALAREALADHEAWVRVGAAGTAACDEDLTAVAERATGVRLPKVQSARDIARVQERAGVPVGCTIETALGVVRAVEIAATPGLAHIAFGAADLAADLNVDAESPTLVTARAQVVLAARAAGLDDVIDGAYTHTKDPDGLRDACLRARALGFTGKSAIHPRQVPIIKEAFATSRDERLWAEAVLNAFDREGGPATLPTGEFVDAAVVARAQRFLGR